MGKKSQQKKPPAPLVQNPKKVFLSLIIVLLAIGSIHFMRYQMGYAEATLSSKQSFYRTKGNPRAKLKIVEFIDFQCGACAKGAKILEEFYDRYPARMLIEVKHFPLGSHKHALIASFFAECAAEQLKFWEYHDLLIEKQKVWAELENALPMFESMAKHLELDVAQLSVCLNDPEMRQAVQDDINEGDALGIQYTPSYFFNDELVVGYIPLEEKLKTYLGESDEIPSADS